MKFASAFSHNQEHVSVIGFKTMQSRLSVLFGSLWQVPKSKKYYQCFDLFKVCRSWHKIQTKSWSSLTCVLGLYRCMTADRTSQDISAMSGVHAHDLLWVWHVMCLVWVKLTWNVSRSYFHTLSNVRVIHVSVLYWHLLNIHNNVSYSRWTMSYCPGMSWSDPMLLISFLILCRCWYVWVKLTPC